MPTGQTRPKSNPAAAPTSDAASTARRVLAELMTLRGGAPAPGEVAITGSDPTLPTRFPIGETAAAVLASVGVALSDIWALKTGHGQRLTIDVRHAATALRSAHLLRRRGADGVFRESLSDDLKLSLSVTQPWPTADGRWFLPHFGLEHLRRRMLDILGCDYAPQAVAAAIGKRKAQDLEDEAAAARACGAMVRSAEEWRAHPQGRVLAEKPVVEVLKIGESAPEPLPAGARPLSGVRVLDLTRILAGPMAARTLAEHGADVLMVTAERLPQIAPYVTDTSHGKRSCYLDLTQDADADRLESLAARADVFSEGYRPGALARRGFGPQALARLRPGIVYVSISCYGDEGPFSERGGWEQLAQTVTGVAEDNGRDRPVLLPAAACDYITGYLAAYGALVALARRAREGGSYHVRVSLCQAAMLIHRQGQLPDSAPSAPLSGAEISDLLVESETHEGTLRHLGPVLRLSETPGFWNRPTPRLGGDPPVWA